MVSLDLSVRTCTRQVIPTGLVATASLYFAATLVYTFEGDEVNKNVAIGFTSTFGALIGLFCLGMAYLFHRRHPKPLPDEERPSSTNSNLHPTMAPMQSREEPDDPPEPPQNVDEPPAHDRSPPDDRDVIPRPLNLPPRPLNITPRVQQTGGYYPRPESGYAQNSRINLQDCPPSLQPGPARYQPPHVSPEQEQPRRQNIDANGSPVLEGPPFRAYPFVGSGYGQLARSAPGVHTGSLHVVNFVMVPASTDFQLFCKKHNIAHDSPRSPKFHLGSPKLRPRPHLGSPRLRKTKRRDARLWARRGAVKKHRVKIRSSTLASPASPAMAMHIVIDDNIESEHSESSTGVDSSPSSGPPSSTDTVFSMEISKA
ncbi:hypothetical protein B0T11DRAFT_90413 [Plectosphaerella cucumerina]|uniref:Uncharacterized protein n=1 Tax=Plectosphaerella cucumerina TaxID=40658 RepID=A0A8K0TIB1_9PEZI|nr:hypothetical protein B0T11DRAFT_90413 [Plectosphaerella cucumerina]